MVRCVDGMGSLLCMLTWFQIANWSPAMLSVVPAPLRGETARVQAWLRCACQKRGGSGESTRYRQYHPVPLGLVDFFNSNIHLVQVATLIETHQCNYEDATAEARKHKRDNVPHAFLRVTPTGTVMPGSRLPDLPSASPTPETLPPTALAPPPSLPAPRPAPLLVPNTPLLLPLALTPNVPEYLAKAPPQVATLDICPILQTTLALWSLP